MAVSSQFAPVSVTLTQAQQVVACPFPFYAASDLKVYADGVLQTAGTHFEVAGGNGSTGSIVFLDGGPTTGAKVIIDRIMPLTHDGDFKSGGPLPGPEVTKLFDRVVLLVQQIASQVTRVVRFAVGTGAQPELVLTGPSVVGSLNGVEIAMLTGTQIVELINLPGSQVNRPTKTFTDSAARALSVPDFVGQLGVQLDQSGAAAIYISTGTAAGNWTAGGTGATVSDGAITTAKLADASVTTAKLADDSVTTAKIADNAVGNAQLANDAVGAAKIIDGAVTEGKLAAGAVTVDKIAEANITGSKLVDGTISTGKLASGAVTPAKMANSPYMLKGRVILTSGTDAAYTPPSGVRAAMIECVGAGGGGGGAALTGGNSAAAGRSGGGGEYASAFVVFVTGHSYNYTVGAGGAGGAAGVNNGLPGGLTRFRGGASGTTVLCQAFGGNGGSGGAAQGGSVASSGGTGGTGGTGDLLVRGSSASPGIVAQGFIAGVSMPGNCALLGGGRVASSNIDGPAADTYGCGGAGGWNQRNEVQNNPAVAGGAGGGGLIIITEYY